MFDITDFRISYETQTNNHTILSKLKLSRDGFLSTLIPNSFKNTLKRVKYCSQEEGRGKSDFNLHFAFSSS